MARPERNTVDYFPFYCEEGNKMFYIEETYGNDGFASFIKILRELAKANHHYLDLSKQTTVMFLSAKCKVSKETLLSIISDLVELGKFDAVLWNENRVVWCQDFVDSIQDAYKKRNNKCITYEGLLVLLTSLGVLKQGFLPKNGTHNTQRKEKERKEKEIKEKNVAKSGAFDLDFIKPDFNDSFSKWIQYKKERGQNYKSQTSLESAYKLLLKCSNEDPKKAAEVVEQSIGNNWAGLFEWKQQFSGQSSVPQYKNEDIWGQQ